MIPAFPTRRSSALPHTTPKTRQRPMANRPVPLITPAEVRAILAEPQETLKPVAWAPRPAPGHAQWLEFASACRLRGEARDDIIFRALYRPAPTAVHR